VQTKDDDPDWMWHQPAPDPWEQTLNKWEKIAMSQYDEPGKGAMWRNESTNSNAPTWKGHIIIPENRGGQKMDIAVWYNNAYTNKNGEEKKERWNVSIQDPWDGGDGTDSSVSTSTSGTYEETPPPRRAAEGDDIPF
jgi:hypothetical protein